MHTSFNRVNGFDDSPFQYARMTYLQDRVAENLKKYTDLRKGISGRINSSHLLMKLLSALTTEFRGDLLTYIERVTTDCERICGTLGITSSYSRGRIHTEGHFYDGCPEIITFVRSERWMWMDLWRDWRSLSAIEVLEHPITDLTIFEPGVMNAIKIPTPDVAVVNIDIPLLACQWRLWKASNPYETNEHFITSVLLPGMMKSHLDLVMFNKMVVKCGLREDCNIRSNLLFGQTSVNSHADDIIDDAYSKIAAKRMSANQILSSIPVLYYYNALDAGEFPNTTPTHQILWAILTQKETRAALVLAFGELAGQDRMVATIAKLKRTSLLAGEDKYFSTGQSTGSAQYLEARFNKFVRSKLK